MPFTFLSLYFLIFTNDNLPALALLYFQGGGVFIQERAREGFLGMSCCGLSFGGILLGCRVLFVDPFPFRFVSLLLQKC